MLLVFEFEHHPSTARLAEVQGVLKGRMTNQVPDTPACSVDVSQIHCRHRTSGNLLFRLPLMSPGEAIVWTLGFHSAQRTPTPAQALQLF